MKKGILILLGVIIIAGMMMMSCPDQQAHKNAIMNDFKEAINESTATEDLGGFEILAGFVGTGLVNLVIDQYLTVDNYYIFSLGKFTDPSNGEQKVASIGVFGNVFSFVDKEKIKEALN